MAKPFKNLFENMSPEAQRRSRAKTKELLAAMPLYELRNALRLTQEQLAESLKVKQPSISKMEKRTDMYISTLRKMIEAMGGSLRIEAVFPDGAVIINSLSESSEKIGKARIKPPMKGRVGRS